MVATEIRSSAIFNFFADGASRVDAEALEWFCRLILCGVVRFLLSHRCACPRSKTTRTRFNRRNEQKPDTARRFLP